MNTKYFIFIFALLIHFFLVESIYSQVTIGVGEVPEKYALLQIKDHVFVDGDTPDGVTATRGGLLMLRVNLVKRKHLFPFVSDTTNNDVYTTLKLKHTGLIVYNCKEIKNEKLPRGINIWNGSEWNGLSEVLGKAEFDYCATTIEVKGTYIENKELTSSNYLKLKVVVDSPGSYTITATSDNGYFFTASGQFMAEGTYTIYAQGQGTPLAAGTDILTMTNNGDKVSCPNNTELIVRSSVANYSLDCSGTVVNGIYTLGNNLASTNTITMKINVRSLGSWEVSSPETDGISFYGSGEYTATGVQYITIQGSGKPTKNGSIHVNLASNSVGGVGMNCSADIIIAVPPKRILSLGGSVYALSSGGAKYNMIKNTENFGLQPNSTFKVSGIDIIDGVSGDLYPSNLRPYLTGDNPVDIVMIGFATLPVNSETVSILVEYVKKGGVLIWCDENVEAHKYAGGVCWNFFKMLYDDFSTIITLDVINPVGNALVYKLPEYDDMILNGPFGDIRGRFFGEDVCCSDGFPVSGPMANRVEWYFNGYDHSRNNAAAEGYMLGLKTKNYPVVWLGDGGAFAGDGASVSYDIYPAYIQNNKPSEKPYGLGSNKRSVVNAKLFCNLITWALLKAETEGINSK